MKPINFMIVSDSPDTNSGLGRITRDLALHIYRSNLPVRLAVAGFNGCGGIDLPFFQYQLGGFASSTDLPKLMPAWLDFTKGEGGILLAIYDLPRLEAFRFPEAYGKPWLDFLSNVDLTLWGYLPIDSHTPKGFTQQTSEILRAFDKVIAYGPYGMGVVEKAISQLSPPIRQNQMLAHLPHGIDGKVFKPTEGGRAILKRQFKGSLGERQLEVTAEDLLLGVNATNQARKDWGSVFEIASRLPTDWKFWFHVDRLFNYWNIPDLVSEFGLQERVFITQPPLEDEILAQLYSACDVTLAPGKGEGFGYPIVESKACGTPAIHVNYAGGKDLYCEDSILLVDPKALALDGAYSIYRPILDVDKMVDAVLNLAGANWEALCREEAKPYEWDSLWAKRWKPHLEALLKDYREGRKGEK